MFLPQRRSVTRLSLLFSRWGTSSSAIMGIRNQIGYVTSGTLSGWKFYIAVKISPFPTYLRYTSRLQGLIG